MAISGTVPTTDSFSWTLYDDFSNTESRHNWTRDGVVYNLGVNFSLNGKMVIDSHATSKWGANGRYYALPGQENLRGIKADISLKSTYYPAYGTGRNVVGIRLADDLEMYMGFFSESRTHNVQVGYRLNGEDIIPQGVASQPLTFEQEYECAIVLDDSGRYVLFFLDNQLLTAANIGQPSDGVSRFFIETDIESWLDTDFSIDNFCVFVPEPSTLLLFGAGIAMIKKRNFRKGGK
jgi:cyclophilin family peptidyl-prolyl cis-trans isomerase